MLSIYVSTRTRSIADTDSVLRTLEDHAVEDYEDHACEQLMKHSHSISMTVWAVMIVVQTQMYLTIYLHTLECWQAAYIKIECGG